MQLEAWEALLQASGSNSVDLRGLIICMSDKFPADTDAVDLKTRSGL